MLKRIFLVATVGAVILLTIALPASAAYPPPSPDPGCSEGLNQAGINALENGSETAFDNVGTQETRCGSDITSQCNDGTDIALNNQDNPESTALWDAALNCNSPNLPPANQGGIKR